MIASAVAERYARAIFELGVEVGQVSELTEQLTNFAETYVASGELRAVLDNPLVDSEKRASVLKDVATRLNLGPVGTNTVRYLALRRRLGALPDIAKRLASLADERAGVVRGSVTSAAPLSEAFYERLKTELETITGRKVTLERKQDPSLIAGVVTRIGDNTIDGSVRGRLEQLGRQLTSA